MGFQHRSKATVLACAVVAGSMVAYGQTRPDFSGVWAVDEIQDPEGGQGGGFEGPGGGGRGPGGFGGPGGRGGGHQGGGRPTGDRPGGRPGPARLQPGQKVTIKQTADRLIVTVPEPGGSLMSSYALDGSETSNPGPAGGTATSKTKWEGVALVSDITQSVSTPRGDMKIKMREIRSLSEDGETMTVRSTIETPRGDRTTTITFMRVPA